MKIFKKFASVAMGCAMAFSAFLLSACEGCNPTEPGLQLNIEKTEPAVVAPKVISEEVQSIVSAVKAQNIAALKTEMDADITITQSAYYSDAMGVKIGENLPSSKMEMELGASATSNILAGEADAVMQMTANMQQGSLTVSQNAYMYEYVRGLSAFSYSATEKSEDISKETLTYSGSVQDILSLIENGGDINDILGGGNLVSTYALSKEGLTGESGADGDAGQPGESGRAIWLDLLTTVLSKATSPENASVSPSTLIELAAMTGSLSASGDTLKIDVNSMIYALAMQFSVSLATIDSTTTISQILDKNVVEKYFKVISQNVSVEEIYNSVCERYPETEYLSLFAPQQGATAYDYLTSVLSSQSIADEIGSEEPLGNVTLGEIVYMYTGVEDSASLITAFKTAAMGMIPQIFTQEALIIPTDITGGALSVSAKNLTCEIKLDKNYNAISQNVGGNIKIFAKSVEDLGDSTYGNTEVDLNISLSEQSEYYSQTQTLTDISNFAVINAITGETTTAGEVIATAPTVEETVESLIQLFELLASLSPQ